MADRASIFQTVNVGVETTAGTAVLALKKLSSMSITPAIKGEVQQFRPAGTKYPTLTAQGKEWVEASVKGLLTYTEIVYALSGLLKAAAITTPGGGTNSRQWLFEPSSTTGDTTVKTFTVEQGDAIRAHRFAYGLFNSLSLKFDRSNVALTGSMLGQALVDNVAMSPNATYTLTANASPPTAGTFTLTYSGQTTTGIAYNATPAAVQAALEALSTGGVGNFRVWASTASGAGTLAVASNVYTVEFVGLLGAAAQTLTGTFSGLTAAGSIAIAAGQTGQAVTTIALVPVLPKQVSVYMADTQAGLASANALTRAVSGEWSLSDRFQMVWPLNAAQTSWAAHVEGEPKLTMSLVMEADADGMGLVTQLRNGATKWVRIKAVGDIIEGAIPYSFQIDQPIKITEAGDLSDADGLFGITWNGVGVHDGTWGKAISVTVVNALTAL